ncbi:MAG: ATP-binding cassette domain-containing protein [Alteromonadaceae bacterium]|nr:ATP-binding cassette domain-containing protein [Alteromonadaceae bacterium]
MSNTIEIQGVSKHYVDCKALDEVSFTIKAGGVTALLGENGAGKTTLFNLVLGRQHPSSGSLSLFGHAPGNNQVKHRIGAILQSANLAENLTVKEHLTLFSSYYLKHLPYDMISKTAMLEDIEHKQVRHLSGGQKQRLLFAMSICGDPDLIILDEPTVALDIASRKQFWQCIEQLKAQGKSIVLCTHYLEEADALADDIVILDKGKLLAETTPSELKGRMAEKHMRFQFKGSQQELENALETRLEPINDYFVVKTATPEKLLAQLYRKSFVVNDLTITQTSLEDAFLSTLNHASH